MSMHIVGPYLTTTNTRKRKDRITKAKQEELERGWRDRNIRLREIGLAKETLEQYTEWVHGRGKKTKTQKNSRAISKSPDKEHRSSRPDKSIANNGYKQEEIHIKIQADNTNISSISNMGQREPASYVTGACAKKPSPTYTGTKMIGIATMHKSNMVPVFSDEEATDIARMRR